MTKEGNGSELRFYDSAGERLTSSFKRPPIDETSRDRALRGPQIPESEHEVVLHEKIPVIDRAVPLGMGSDEPRRLTRGSKRSPETCLRNASRPSTTAVVGITVRTGSAISPPGRPRRDPAR